jgi:hypothetical protein
MANILTGTPAVAGWIVEAGMAHLSALHLASI